MGDPTRIADLATGLAEARRIADRRMHARLAEELHAEVVAARDEQASDRDLLRRTAATCRAVAADMTEEPLRAELQRLAAELEAKADED